MTLHLIKLSVGPANLGELIAWQNECVRDLKRSGHEAALMHITRQTPKRAEELLAGGSIYWVIGGVIVARQRLLELRPVTRNGIPHCALIYVPDMIRVRPLPRRPFQGWRYLEAKDAPPDLAKGEEEMSDEMRKELAAAGLL